MLLALATFAVYSRVWHFEFVNFDDPEYVTDNNHVRAGLTWDALTWALTTTSGENWFPLTRISHIVDYQLFGLRSGWHHLTNLLLHALATLLLFAALKRMTGALWRSALVAFLFALHPLHVESVAWIAERKDVLCAFFWCLTLWCYARYAERPGVRRYCLVLLAFCCALTSKPMAVTLPCVLLLLDVWPLRRWKNLSILWEKLPLVALSAAVSVVTYIAQQRGHAIQSLRAVPAGERFANALVTYVVYIGRMFWPVKLAVFYPYAHKLPVWYVLAAAATLAVVTALVLRLFRSYPYLATGWFWYLGTLVPVIGLVQVGGQSSADRYTYLPTVGLGIMISWAAADLLGRYPRARTAVAIPALAACSACVALTWFQLSYWANTEALFRHALDVTTDNHIAHNNLADYYLGKLRNSEARTNVDEALRIQPSFAEAHVNLATIFRREGNTGEAEREYRLALTLQPRNVEGHAGYGALLFNQGRANEALGEFRKAAQLRPESADGHFVLGRMLASMGRTDQAIPEFLEAVRLRPDQADAHHSLGVVFLSRGRLNDALAEFQAEARLRPDDAAVHNNLGQLLASQGRLDESIGQFSEALRIQPDSAAARRGLAVAMARRAGSHAR